MVQEQLARLAQKEKERDSAAALAAVGGACQTHGDVTSAVIMEQSRTHEEQEKAKILVSRSKSHTGTRCRNTRLH